MKGIRASKSYRIWHWVVLTIPRGRGKGAGAVDSLRSLLLLVALVGFLGLVTDQGHLYVVRSTLRNATYSASLAAAANLRYGPEEARSQAQLQAQRYAIGGIPVTLASEDIEIGAYDIQTKRFTVLAPGEEANANSVRVTAQRPQVRNNFIALFFMRLMGQPTLNVRSVSVVYYAPSLRWAVIDENGATLSSSAASVSYGSDFGPTDPPWLITMEVLGTADLQNASARTL